MISRIQIDPLPGSVAAEVVGFDCSLLGDAEIEDQLRSAFRQFHTIVFRDLDLSTEQQLSLARVFGDPVIREQNETKDDTRLTQHVSNTLEDGVFGTGELDFHLDQLFWETPLKALMLYGIEIPKSGSVTKFVDTSRAYAKMPEPLRRRIDGLECLNAYTFAGGLAKDWGVKGIDSHQMTAVHPIVWRDRDSEELGLWVNKLTTVEVVGLAEDDSKAVIQEVRSYLYDDAITYAHQWREKDLVLWNNRVVQHARVPFNGAEPRTLRRTTLL